MKKKECAACVPKKRGIWQSDFQRETQKRSAHCGEIRCGEKKTKKKNLNHSKNGDERGQSFLKNLRSQREMGSRASTFSTTATGTTTTPDC